MGPRAFSSGEQGQLLSSYRSLVEHCTMLYRKFVAAGLCALEKQLTGGRQGGWARVPARSQAGTCGLG